jgi:ubiquinone/menaquinone biosynthesis C-methylase UbiE
MKYSKMLRELFSGISLNAEDLLLLESFQVNYLPDRVPQKEFATLIRKYPFVKNYLISKNPTVGNFINTLLETNEEIKDEELINEYCDELLWEIADLIVYNKFPETYDEKVPFNWSIEEIIKPESLNGKVVADVGAGSGMLAFMLAKYAETVFAIEPISSFRTFIRQKATKINCSNLYAIDGFLESIPFPGDTFDVLFTSNAIGWNIEKELHEIERVVKPNGQAVHIMRVNENIAESPVHVKLISGEWNYKFSQSTDENGMKVKYLKTLDS